LAQASSLSPPPPGHDRDRLDWAAGTGRTPTGIIERIAQATRKAVAEPAYKQMLIDAGMEATLSTQTPKNSDIPSQPMLLSGRQSSRRSPVTTGIRVVSAAID
jgi:hypothetical protein